MTEVENENIDPTRSIREKILAQQQQRENELGVVAQRLRAAKKMKRYQPNPVYIRTEERMAESRQRGSFRTKASS